MPPGFTRRWAFLAPATLAAILCIGLVCRRHSHGPSLLLEKYVGGKAEPGIPRTWISNKDMADSPMLHSSSSSASLPGQGILSSATHPERISLASAPPSGALAAAQRQGQEKSHLAPKAASGPSLRREDKGDAIPSKVQDLKNQGLKQAKVGEWGKGPSKKEFHKMVMKAEQDAALLSQKHPRSIMGAHWRMAVSHLSDRHSQLAADKAAAAGARLKQERKLHELKVEHEKDMGVYAPKAALKAMGADKLRVGRVSSATHAGGTKSSGNVEDSPERYPAVSYFSRLREMSPAAGAARPAASRDGHVARGMLYQRNDAEPSEDDHRQDDYAGDASPVAWRREENGGRHVESERSRIEGVQRRLADKWRRLMANPPPVTAETRPDIVDRTDHSVPDYDEFLSKKREMKLFGAAIDGFESDPEFNPLTVMLAHSLTKYGIPPPESDDMDVWHSWYIEVKDRYHVLEQQVAALAEGRGSGNIDHGEDDHRRDRFQHVQRQISSVESDGETRLIRREVSARAADMTRHQRVMALRVDHAPDSRLVSNEQVNTGREQSARDSTENGDLKQGSSEIGEAAPYGSNQVGCGSSQGCFKGVGQSKVDIRRTQGHEIRKIQESLDLIRKLLETRQGGLGAPRRIESPNKSEHNARYSKTSTWDWMRGASNSGKNRDVGIGIETRN